MPLWRGQSFMAIGMKDPVMGEPAMLALRRSFPGCPEPMRVQDGAHFLQELGAGIAEASLASWGGC